MAKPDAPLFWESGDGGVSGASRLSVVGIWRIRAFCLPVARGGAVRARGFRFAYPMKVFFANTQSIQIKFALITSNLLRGSSSATLLVMHIPYRAAMVKRGPKDDRPMALYRTGTVTWVRAGGRQRSLVNSHTEDTSTPSEGVEGAWSRGFRLSVVCAAAEIPSGSVRAAKAFPSLTSRVSAPGPGRRKPARQQRQRLGLAVLPNAVL